MTARINRAASQLKRHQLLITDQGGGEFDPPVEISDAKVMGPDVRVEFMEGLPVRVFNRDERVCIVDEYNSPQ